MLNRTPTFDPEPLMATLQRVAGNRPLYACIDLASAPQAFASVVQPAGPQALCLFDGALTDNAGRASPWVVPVHTGVDPHRLWLSCDIAMKAPAVTWLASPLSCQGLRDRLARRLDIQFEDGSQWLLRFFDPRILDELHAHLEPSNSQSFFALGGDWYWLDRDGALQQRRLAGPMEPDPLRPPLRPTPLEEAALTMASEAGHVLTRASSRWPDGFARLRGTQRIALAKRACAEADGLGLQATDHRVQLLILAAAHGAGYFDGPAWRRHASRLRSGEAGITTLLSDADMRPESPSQDLP
jgi:hypothetical protein